MDPGRCGRYPDKRYIAGVAAVGLLVGVSPSYAVMVMAIILLDASVVLWSGGLLEGILIASLLAPSFLMLRLFQRAARK